MPEDDDIKLFRSTIGPVRPITDQRDHSRPPASSPQPRQTQADEQQVVAELLLYSPEELQVECGEEISWRHPGLQLGVMRKLRRGRFAIADELDLHGMRLPVAEQAITEFISHSRELNYGCVRIVHGKGLRSRKQPILKNLTAKLLRRMPGVLAYCSARPVDGGTGAVYILLRN